LCALLPLTRALLRACALSALLRRSLAALSRPWGGRFFPQKGNTYQEGDYR
jgi:hypothetical protein